jgi:hypothetical protein
MIVAIGAVMAKALLVTSVLSEVQTKMSDQGSPVTSSINAIIFSPGNPADLALARGALAHVRRRGYRMVAFASDWSDVDKALDDGRANVVVFGCDVRRGGDDPTAATQALRPPVLTREWVRDIIDHGATPPAGISPETVAAARRLARMVGGNSGGWSRYVKDQGVPEGVLRQDV